MEDNQALFDIIANAQDLTMMNRGRMYVLFDNFGKISLKSIAKMKADIVIDQDTGQKYDYTSSIDSETYNQIKLYYDNKDTGQRELYITKSTKNINAWGMGQAVSTGVMAAASLLAWWKNNSFTQAAIKADEQLKNHGSERQKK